MKTGQMAVVLAGIVVVVGIAYSFTNGQGTEISRGSIERPSQDDSLIHVDDLAATPEVFQQEMVLIGIVAGVNKDKGVFSIIDAREFEACGVLTCAKYSIPVKTSGEIPAPKTKVKITGNIVRENQGLLFVGKHVEEMP